MERFLKQLKYAHGKAAQAGDVFRAAAGAYPAAILIAIPVDDVMHAFDDDRWYEKYVPPADLLYDNYVEEIEGEDNAKNNKLH